MQNTWTIRLLIAFGLLGVAAYFLVPTVIYFNLSAEETDEVKQDRSAFSKHVPGWAQETHIVPGLDLQGGIHMVLGVNLDKAVSDRARRSASRLRAELEDKKIGFERVDHITDPDTGYGDRIRIDFKESKDKESYEADIAKFFGDLAVVSSGSTELLLRVHPDFVASVRKDAVDQTMKTIRNRIDKMGVTEPSIAKRGDDQIQIQLPGYNNPEEAKSLIGRTAQLEFMMCEDETDFLTKLTDLPEGTTLQQSGFQRPDGGLGNDIYLEFPEDQMPAIRRYLNGKMPPATTMKYGRLDRPGETGKKLMRTFTLKSAIELTGDDLVDARVAMGSPENPRPYVSLDFSIAGGRRFGDLTTKNVGRRMAIVLEDIVDSAPVINEPITGGSAQITMGGNRTHTEMIQDANELALVLKAGALPAPVTFREERSVGPSLGAEAVQAGKLASMIGGIFIVLFMLFYYRVAGIISVVGLIFNMAFVLATLSWLGGTVTLPGIAGLLLTVGMAVDANIIINERIREELREGKTPRSAVAAGYDNAFSAIIDANVTTFIAGMVLWQFGTGPIQNFATTLLIGVVASVVSAIFITRIFFDMLTARGPDNLSI
jgi:protein-export membrane protein SecD